MTYQPPIRTILSLDYYAKIMGISPPHFWQSQGSNVFPLVGSCSDVWFQYDWQDADRISRDTLAQVINGAEEDVCAILGYWPGPKWISKEMHDYPQYHRREYYGSGSNVRGMYKSVIADKGKFIEAGQRAVTLLGDSIAVVYTDEDGDGLFETATVTVNNLTVTDVCEINVYFEDQNGEQEYEIREARSKTLSGGTFTGVYDSWLFVDPDLLAEYPTADGPRAIDISTIAKFVTNVDVYREYTDNTQESAEFSWEPKTSGLFYCDSCNGSGCAACANPTQTGCIHVRDVKRGILVPTPATYDEDDAQWSSAKWSECREPDTVKIWYRAGELDEKFLRGSSCQSLKHYLAQAIAWIATARLERPPCSCNNTETLFRQLRKDLSLVDDNSHQIGELLLNNPLGTRRGEVKAWQRLSRLIEDVRDFALI